MTAAPTQSMTVAATVRAMRRAGAAKEPVPAAEVAAWARTFMTQLYGLQKPVRYECRPKYTVEPWIQAEANDVVHAVRRGLDVRALYLHPKTEKAAKPHRFEGGDCLDCGDGEFYAGPNCEPPAPNPDSRAAFPFNPVWIREPLQALNQFATIQIISLSDAQKWKRETTYLLERIDQYIKDTCS